MDAVYWDQQIKRDVKTYTSVVLGTFELVLPSKKTVDKVGYENTLNEDGPINGMAVAREDGVRLRCAGSDLDTAAEVRDCMKVGTHIYVLIYEDDNIGTLVNQSPIQCPFPDFHKAVLRDLRMLATVPSGQALLASLEANGGDDAKVVIRFRDGFSNDNGSKVDFRVTQPGSLTTVRGLTPTFTAGAAVGEALVGYNPMFFGVPKIKGLTDNDDCVKQGKWGAPEQKTPDVTLFHELIHADDALRGIFEPENPKISCNGVNVKLSELRAVGLAEFGEEIEFGNAMKIYSENRYRKERGFVLRDYYSDANEARGPITITPRMQDLLAYLDPAFMVMGQYLNPSVMTVEAFKKSSKHKGSRNKVVAVDNELRDYNLNTAHDPDPLVRVRGLIKVLKVCHEYKAKAKAKRNVADLIVAAGNQVRAITAAMVQAMPNPPTENYYQTLRALSGILDESVYTVLGPGPRPPFAETDGEDARRALSGALSTLYINAGGKLADMQRLSLPNQPIDDDTQLSANSVQALIQADGQMLTAMIATAPTVTGLVINEMLAVAGQANVDLVDTRVGSAAGPSDTGHFVKWGQWCPDDIRLATYIHELTHVSTHRSYNNTPVMFSFASGKSAEEIRQIERDRTVIVRELMALVTEEDFNGYQRHWLVEELGQHKGKLPYAIDDGSMLVRGALSPARPLDPLTGQPNGPKPPDDPEYTRVYSGLVPISQVLWEFDTVVNQCLIYMHMWQIPLDNDLYARLRDVAQDLYDARALARAPVVNPGPQQPLLAQDDSALPRDDVSFFAVNPQDRRQTV